MHSSADILKTTVCSKGVKLMMYELNLKAVDKINLNKINFTDLEVFVSV